MKQFAILFAAVCAMTFMSGQAEAQCRGGYGGRSSGFGISVGSGFGGGYGGFNSFAAPVYRQPVYRPVYGGSFGGGFGGYGVPAYRGGGVSIGVSRGYGGRRGCGW